MNNPSNPLSVNEYAKEPSPSSTASSLGAISQTAAIGTVAKYNCGRRGTNQGVQTLKARIKRNMLNDSIKLPVASAASTSPANREGSVFEAASALASLGLTSHASSLNEGRRGAVDEINATGYADAPAVNVTANPTASLGHQQHNHASLALVQPSLSLTVSQQTHVGHNDDVKSCASLIGTDVTLTFPQKLMELLANPEISDIITWLPHGKGFMILQKNKFAKDVMPLYFKHSKFTSFTRKLHRWGFTRVSRGSEMGAHYHKYFQRGNCLLCMHMHCQAHHSKPSSHKKTCHAINPVTTPKASSKIIVAPTINSSLSAASSLLNTFATKEKPSNLPLPNMQPITLNGNTGHGSDYGKASASFHQQAQVQGNPIEARSHQDQNRLQNQAFQLVQSIGEVNQYNGSSLPASHLQPLSTLQSCMKRSHHAQHIMGQRHHHLNSDQAATFQQILGGNTSSSRNDQPAITDRFNILKTCNEQALLNALVGMNHTKDKGLLHQTRGVMGSGGISQANNLLTSSFQAQHRIPVAMEAQQQRFNHFKEWNRSSTAGSMDIGIQDNSTHALMLAKMRELSESNHTRIVGLAAAGLNNGPKVTNIKAQTTNLVTLNDAAQLYDEVARRQQQGTSNVSKSSPSGRQHGVERKYAWRASAA